MPPPNGQRYSLSCYQIGPDSTRTCDQTSTGIIPERRKPYRLVNVGLTDIWAEAIYGTFAQWLGAVVGHHLNPGEEKVLDLGDRPYYYTAVKIKNNGKRLKALVHIGHTDGWAWYEWTGPGWVDKVDWNLLAKKLVSFGVSFVPYVGKGLSFMVDFFWPENQPSVWDQVKDQVKNLVDEKTNNLIKGLLGGELEYVRVRITNLKKDLEDNVSKHNSAEHYMNIAEDFIGLENKFIIRKEDNPAYVKINYFILPLYSNFITLKIQFYQYGIVNPHKIGLTDDNVYRLKNYSERLLHDVNEYVHKTTIESLEDAYSSCDPDNIYNAMATARTYLGMHALEYLDVWRHIYEHPESEEKPYNNALLFSEHFGRPTPWHAKQITPVEDVPQPLQPKIVNGHRNRIGGIDVWIWRIRQYAAEKISGIKLYWTNGDTDSCGKWTAEKHFIDFKGAYLKKLIAWGDGALDCLEFELSDGRKESYGTTSDARGVHQVFELKNHHIAGIYLSGGQGGLSGQACNISVSYQITPPHY